MTALPFKENDKASLTSTGLLFFMISVFPLILSSCSREAPPEPEIITLMPEEAGQDALEIRESVSVEHLDGLELSLWASEKMLGDMVGLDMDPYGRAWVTITNRSRNSEFDIRDVDDSWRIEAMKWETVEDRRDFLHRELAPERSDENTWLPDRNEDGSHDWRDLAVKKEEIWRLEDTNNDGLADFAQLYIRDFHDEVTDVAGAIAYYNGEVFLGVGPDMWRIRDTSGDGMADWKESISHGYNVHIGFSGHGMSGAKKGPDGRIYWGIGDMGFNVVDQEGSHWYYPNEGAILRSEPDGSNFEVFASGLRNTHEFDFDKHGNLITVDNDGDHPGEYERLMYLINGSDSGWRINWQFGKYDDPVNNNYKVWMDENYYTPRFEDQSAHILPPLSRYHAGPAGFAYNPGTALSEEWEDHFFVMSFRGSSANSPIYAFTLEESGASFELATDQEVMRGILPVGIDFGPDGALYMTDWIQGWGQNNEGRIWKLDSPDHARSPVRLETKELLAEDFSERSDDDLAGLLSHEDMRVRQKAQFGLAGRDAANHLQTAAEQSSHQLGRIHGIWGLAQIGRRNPDAVEPLTGLLDDSDSEIRAQAAKMLGDVRYEPAGDALIPLLSDENPRVQLFAAEALGRIGYEPAFEPVLELLEANDDEDVYLRHAGAIALYRIGNVDAVNGLADHPSRAVRIAAVVALKRMESPGVARFLEDDDEFIATNAARAVMDDKFIDDAIPHLAAMLGQNRFTNEPLMRRAINASLYSGTGQDAERIAAFALRDDISEELRIEAINTLEHWEKPSIFDRVTGWYRGEISNSTEDGQQAVTMVAERYLDSGSEEVKVATLNAVGNLALVSAIPQILEIVHTDPSEEVRIASLNALLALDYDRLEETLSAALDDQSSGVRMNALSVLVDTDLPSETKVALLTSVVEEGSAEEKKQAYNALSRLDLPGAHEILIRELELLINGRLESELHLDLVLASERADAEEVNNTLAQYESQKPEGGKLAEFIETLYGGSESQGRQIFYNDVAAQCIRCHVVDDRGAEVGPDLTAIADRLSREELLIALVDPSAQPVSGFTIVTVTKEDGETVRGIYHTETDEELSLMVSSERVDIPKSEIAGREQSPSAMPAMGDLLTRSQIRDLVEYISTLRE
jgi:quinoprotein glucose dehydrogenase